MAAKRYVAKIVKFMLSNPADLKRLELLSGISFSKYVKGKLDEDTAGVDPAIALLQAQVTRLEQEIQVLKRGEVKCTVPAREDKTRVEIDNWFEE
jgi:hypothetical protein